MRSPHSPEQHQFKNSVLRPPLSVGRSKKRVISCLRGTIVCINLTSVLLNLSFLWLPGWRSGEEILLFLTAVSSFKPSDALIWGIGEDFCE